MSDQEFNTELQEDNVIEEIEILPKKKDKRSITSKANAKKAGLAKLAKLAEARKAKLIQQKLDLEKQKEFEEFKKNNNTTSYEIEESDSDSDSDDSDSDDEPVLYVKNRKKPQKKKVQFKGVDTKTPPPQDDMMKDIYAKLDMLMKQEKPIKRKPAKRKPRKTVVKIINNQGEKKASPAKESMKRELLRF